MSDPLTLARLERALAELEPQSTPVEGTPDRAAVAAILRFDRERPEVLLMQRSRRDGDRWSGHISFPGGREESHDPDLVTTAIRETREEVGLDLERRARLLGQLDAIQAIARGKPLRLSITPFVFHCAEPGPLTLNHEAESAFWFPLDRAARGELDAPFEYEYAEQPLTLPSWRYDRYVVWGMTHRMLVRLLELARGFQSY